jgi:hypothetical protein
MVVDQQLNGIEEGPVALTLPSGLISLPTLPSSLPTL